MYVLFIFVLLFITSFFGIFLTNIFYFWLFLELNVITYVMYVVFYRERSFEPCVRYFLIQCFGSLLFLFVYFYFLCYCSRINYIYILFFCLLFKLGVFPLHHWFPYLSYYLELDSSYILFTLQKLLSFFILFYLGFGYILLIFSLLGVVYSVLSQFSIRDLRVFISFSSISHSGWIFLGGLISFSLFFFYFVFYSLILFFLFYSFYYCNVLYSDSFFLSFFFIFFYFLTISGFPPTLGFYIKWGVLYNIFFFFGSLFFFVIFIMLVLGFFVYLRFFYYYYIGEYNSFFFNFGLTNFFFIFFILFSPFF